MRLIIFDLGETLIFYEGRGLNWTEHYHSALAEAFKFIDYQFTDAEMENCLDVLNFYNTRKNYRLFEVRESEVLQKVADVCEQKINWRKFESKFFNYFQRKGKPEKSAFTTLHRLRKKGCKLAVLSDAAYGMPKKLLIADLGDLQESFDAIYSSTDIGFRKPHPKGIEKIVNEFQVSKDSVLFVGNEKKDIDTAANFGVKSLLLSKSEKFIDFGQTATIKTLSDIENYIV